MPEVDGAFYQINDPTLEMIIPRIAPGGAQA
jgi:hypothetical protein